MSIESTLGLPPTPEHKPIQPSTQPAASVVAKNEDPEKDVLFVAENSIDQAISAGISALEGSLAAAKDTDLPAAYLAFAGVLNALASANQTKLNIRHSKAKIDLDRKKAELIQKKIETMTPDKGLGSTTINQTKMEFVFNGNTEDLQKQLQELGVLKPHFAIEQPKHVESIDITNKVNENGR